MSPADVPLTRDRILATAEDVIRRFGPAKATVVDVARALGVSHAAVYRHVATKAELRDLVVGCWVEATMPPLRAIAALPGPASLRLRQLFDALIAVKRRRATDDSELFAINGSFGGAHVASSNPEANTGCCVSTKLTQRYIVVTWESARYSMRKARCERIKRVSS